MLARGFAQLTAFYADNCAGSRLLVQPVCRPIIGATPNSKGVPKEVVYCRIDPKTIAGLDQICESMRPKPTRAQLIDFVLADYVESRLKENRK